MDVQTIQNKIPAILKSYGVIYAGVFGSVSRGTATATSDVDLLIELEKPIGVFRLVSLKHELEASLGMSVDVAVRDSVHPLVMPFIVQDLKRVYEV